MSKFKTSFIAILMSVILAFSFVACGTVDSDDTTASSPANLDRTFGNSVLDTTENIESTDEVVLNETTTKPTTTEPTTTEPTTTEPTTTKPTTTEATTKPTTTKPTTTEPTTTKPTTTKPTTTKPKSDSTTKRSETTTKPKTTKPSSSTDKNSKTVYITPTGKRYHLISTCGGKNSYAISLTDAKNRGYTPCKKCAS